MCLTLLLFSIPRNGLKLVSVWNINIMMEIFLLHKAPHWTIGFTVRRPFVWCSPRARLGFLTVQKDILHRAIVDSKLSMCSCEWVVLWQTGNLLRFYPAFRSLLPNGNCVSPKRVSASSENGRTDLNFIKLAKQEKFQNGKVLSKAIFF